MTSAAKSTAAGDDGSRSGFLPDRVLHLHPTRLCNLASIAASTWRRSMGCHPTVCSPTSGSSFPVCRHWSAAHWRAFRTCMCWWTGSITAHGSAKSCRRSRRAGSRSTIKHPRHAKEVTRSWPNNCFLEDRMRNRDIALGLAVILPLAAILLPLAAVLLISTAVLLIPAVPLVAVAVLAAPLLLAARSEQACAAGPPQIDAQPHRGSLPRASARVSSRRT